MRQLRLARGLSQEELADLARLNRTYIGMIEREENAPTVDVLESLADALEVEPVALIMGKQRRLRLISKRL